MEVTSVIKVRFSETDALGHVNNCSYFIYFEQARAEFFEALGYTVGDSDANVALVSTSCDFMSQAYFGQTLSVSTTVEKIGNKSVTLIHTIKDQNTNQNIAVGKAVVVLLDETMKKGIVLSEEIRQKLTPYLIEKD